MDNRTYQRNRDVALNKAKEHYKNNNKRLKKQARDKYRSDCNWTRTQNHLVLKQTLNHSGNYRVWIHSETPTRHCKNIQSNALYI